ncbi:hypothetical protein D3C85_976200 [compost metagenome]
MMGGNEHGNAPIEDFLRRGRVGQLHRSGGAGEYGAVQRDHARERTGSRTQPRAVHPQEIRGRADIGGRNLPRLRAAHPATDRREPQRADGHRQPDRPAAPGFNGNHRRYSFAASADQVPRAVSRGAVVAADRHHGGADQGD